jgi:ABC-2 type transport system ATP-binding protein
VFLNSHLLSEVEITCDRVAFINHGEVVHTSALRTASGRSLVEGELTVQIRARPEGGWEATPDGHWGAVTAGLRRWSEHVRVDGEYISLTLPGEADLPAIARYLVEHNVDVYALSPQRISLEDLFMRLVGTEEEL